MPSGRSPRSVRRVRNEFAVLWPLYVYKHGWLHYAPDSMRMQITTTLLVALLLGGLSYPYVAVMADGAWAPVGDLATPHVGHTATVLADGRVLVVGGERTSAGPVTDATEVYDPTSRTWASVAPLPSAVYGHTATRLGDGRVLVTGGRLDSNATISSSYLFDPATGTWSQTASMKSRRAVHTAARLADGRVLVAGGTNGKKSLKTSELYDPSTGSWAPAGKLAKARQGHGMVALGDGSVIVLGGLREAPAGGGALDSVERFDPTMGRWRPAGTLSGTRSQHTVTLLRNDTVLVAGGIRNNGEARSAVLYDPATETVRPTGDLPREVVDHAAVLLPDGRVLVAGGFPSGITTSLYDPETGAFSEGPPLQRSFRHHTLTMMPDGTALAVSAIYAEVFTATSGQWDVATPTAVPRASHSATRLADGRVLVAGGYGSAGPIASCEIFDADANRWTQVASLGVGRRAHRACLLPDGRVLVIGGLGANNTPIAECEIYDPVRNSWQRTGSLRLPRYLHSATVLTGGQVIVVGGQGPITIGGPTGECEVWSSTTGTWSGTGELAVQRRSHVAVLLSSGELLVSGGEAQYNSDSRRTEIYDPSTRLWSEAGLTSSWHVGTAATLLDDGRVFVAGNGNSYESCDIVETFQPGSNTWSVAMPLLFARQNHAMVRLEDGRVLVLAGTLGSGQAVPSELIRADGTRSVAVARIPAIQSGGLAADFTVTLLLDGRVLVVGGSGDVGYGQQVFLFTAPQP